MTFKVIGHHRERARQIEVIAVNKAEDVAGRLRDTLVNCMDLTPIFLADPERESIFIATNDLEGFIGATTVDNDVLEIGIILIENRQNRLFQEAALIE